MAKTASTKTGASKAKSATPRKPARAKAAKKPAATPRRSAKSDSDATAVDALLKMLESPLVADLLAVGATAALAAVTEHRASRRTGAAAGSSAVLKAAGSAAAAAIGRRLATEVSEIRKAAKTR